MNNRIIKMMRRCRVLFRLQVTSWIIAIIGGMLSALSLIFMVRDWLIYRLCENRETQLIFLMAGILTIVFAVVVSRLFLSGIQKLNSFSRDPINVKVGDVEEWIAAVSNTMKLKKLENGVWFGRFAARFCFDVYIVPEGLTEADQSDFQSKCIILAKNRFHIQFRGTKNELSHKLILFIFLRQVLNPDEKALWVDVDHYQEGGFRMAVFLDVGSGRMQLPQIDGRIGTYIPHYSSGVEWLLQSVSAD